MSNLYGSLVVSTSVSGNVSWPIKFTDNSKYVEHTNCPSNGSFIKMVDGKPKSIEVSVPARGKHYQIDTIGLTADSVNETLKECLPVMESTYEDSRQLYKYWMIQKKIHDLPDTKPYVSIIHNNVKQHGYFAILSQSVEVFLYGVYDIHTKTVHLIWTTDGWFASDTKCDDPGRYLFYRFPVLKDRPLFVYTQAVCSKWYKWSGLFTGNTLKCFDLLENFLYKDPEAQYL